MQPERALPEPGSCAHLLAPYDSEDGYLRAVLPHVRAVLRDGGGVLVVAGQDHLDLLAERLGDESARLDRRLRTTWYTHPPRTLTAYHEYAEPWARRRTLLVGEPVWTGRSERDVREWTRYEAAINLAFAGAPVTTLCLYDTRGTPEAVLDGARRTHPWVLGADGPRPSGGYVEPRDFLLSGDDVPFEGAPESRVTIDFVPHDLGRLRRLVEDTARGAGFDRDTAGSLVLSVSEIAANTVEHGAGRGSVSMWTAGDELVCEIADSGGRLDVPLPGFLPPLPESSRGYGLWLSRQLCDLVETRTADGTLRVRLYMVLPPAGDQGGNREGGQAAAGWRSAPTSRA